MMKIIIVTKNWLGDILFQLPAIEAIHARYPEAEIVCLAPSRCREILEAHPAVSRVIPFDERKEHRSIFARLRIIWKLRREKWDQAYLFHRSRSRAFLLFLAGAKERIGYGTRRRLFLTKAIEEPKQPMHHMEYFLELLRRAGFPIPEKAAYRFYTSKKEDDTAEKILEKHKLTTFVCFHLGANWEPKRWPTRHFAQLADLIAEKWDLPVVLTGASGDLALASDVMELVRRARVISLVGQTSLGELGAIYKRASFVVSGDSGPMHIAAGVGTPIVALFGPTDPDLTGPRGSGEQIILKFIPEGFNVPWYGKKLPEGGWLTHIRPEEVVAAIERKNWARKIPPTPGESSGHSRGDGVTGSPEVKAGKSVPHHTSRILFITLSNIGDVILTTPVIAALASQFPQAELTVVAGPKAQGLLRRSCLIHRLVIYDKEASLRNRLQFLREIRRESYDLVVDLRNTAIPFLVRAKRRSPLICRFRNTSMRERHLEILKMMGLSVSAPPFDFFAKEDEVSLLRKIKAKGIGEERNWILVAAAAASELKTWRLEGFKEVIASLLDERNENIFLVGDERERKIVSPLVLMNPSRVHNLAGETTLPELAALVSRCALLLTNDSAVMHLGFELNRPVVAIFGPTNPKKYGRVDPKFRIVREPVFCSPCERSTCRFDRQACFEDLKSEKVLQVCRELLPEEVLRREHIPSL